MNRTEQVLTEHSVKPLFYYDGTITVCLLVRDNKALSRGLSICSPLDNFAKRVGRAKALGRAVQAIVRRDSSGKIYHGRFGGKGHRGLLLAEMEFGVKSCYLPELTSREQSRLSRRNGVDKSQSL